MAYRHTTSASFRLRRFEEIKKIAGDRGGECLSADYINARRHMEFRCAEPDHPSWRAYPDHIIRGSWCPHCRAVTLRDNLVGQRFGSLTPRRWVSDVGRRPGWYCDCTCGGHAVVRPDLLKSGHTRSCGCRESPRKLATGVAASKAVFRRYLTEAHRRGLDFELSYDEFISVTQARCIYCGDYPSNQSYRKGDNGPFVYSGIDRRNNDLGYTTENTVSACKICNRAKGAMSEGDFRKWITRLRAFNQEQA